MGISFGDGEKGIHGRMVVWSHVWTVDDGDATVHGYVEDKLGNFREKNPRQNR